MGILAFLFFVFLYFSFFFFLARPEGGVEIV